MLQNIIKIITKFKNEYQMYQRKKVNEIFGTLNFKVNPSK